MIGPLGSRLRPWTEDAAAGVRLLRGLPRLLHRPITSEQAHAVLRRRLDRREARFVTLVQRAIYDVGLNPCRRLLDLAGCEAGDFTRLVEQEGVEGALQVLYRKGVYLTLDEFKGRRPTVRGSMTVPVNPSLFADPDSVRQFASLTSGSRGRSTVVVRDLPYIRDVGVNRCVSTAARGGLSWRTALWGIAGHHARPSPRIRQLRNAAGALVPDRGPGLAVLAAPLSLERPPGAVVEPAGRRAATRR